MILLALFASIIHTQAKPRSVKQDGISFFDWGPGHYSTPDSDLSLSYLAATGADWISLIHTGFLDSITSTVIYSSSLYSPTDADLTHAIDRAHRLGLKVMLKIHVNLIPPNEVTQGWRIGEGFDEAKWAEWFVSYGDFINHYAELAQANDVEQYSIGNELVSTENRENNWRDVIAGVRGRFIGPITYSTGRGSLDWAEVDIRWWDAVDYIGINAYYPLTDKNDPTIDEINLAWQPYLTKLETLSAQWNRPVLFTEIGYRSLDGSNRYPWDFQIGGQSDIQEQADLYVGFLESVYNKPWFAGMFFWAWTPDPLEGSLCDTEYTPHNKPAENVLRKWFGMAERSLEQPVILPDYSRSQYIYTDFLASGWENRSWYTSSLDFAASDYVYSGSRSIFVTFPTWGAVSLHHEAFITTPFYYLEFYVRGASMNQSLAVFANDQNNTQLRYRKVHDCRYIEGGSIGQDIWKLVQIPLSHLQALDRPISRLSIANWNPQQASFWIDNIRLVGAILPFRLYLPQLLNFK